MEKGATFMNDNLSGYNLPAESLAEIRSILTRRVSSRFSDGLTSEGRAAMKEVSETTSVKETELSKETGEVNVGKVEKGKQKRRESQANKIKPANTTESSNKTSRTRSNSEHTGATKLNKQPSKKEVVSVRNEVSKNSTQDDNQGELFKAVIDVSEVNIEPDSVEKCLEWMEDNNQGTESDTHASAILDNGANEDVNES